MTKRLAAERGFTLVELLIVLMIIGILVAITMVSYVGYSRKAESATAQANVHVIVPSVEAYAADNGTYTGMTLLGLKTAYDQSIDPSMYKLTSLTASDYCISSAVGGQAWKRTGPGTDIVAGECP